METRTMSLEQIESYGKTLRLEERCEATTQKYVGAATAFFDFLPEEKAVTRELALAWKAEISAKNAASTVNVMLSAVNRFFAFMSMKRLKTQRRIFRDRDRELTKAEYLRLLDAARRRGNPRLYYLTQTLAATGIRVSELRFVTVESLRSGATVVDCKGKRREILIPKNLRGKLLTYCKDMGIASGSVFVTRSGKPLNRSNIWRELQRPCRPPQGLSPQFSPSVRRHVLPGGEGHSEAGRPPRSCQHKHHADLYHGERRGTRAPD